MLGLGSFQLLFKLGSLSEEQTGENEDCWKLIPLPESLTYWPVAGMHKAEPFAYLAFYFPAEAPVIIPREPWSLGSYIIYFNKSTFKFFSFKNLADDVNVSISS